MVAVVGAVFCLARLYLGVDHPDDALLAVAIAVAIAVTAFRYFTRSGVSVAYRHGRAAHVDVTGRRGQAIRQAVRDQLGLTVTEIKPVGLESSAGSTPLRLRAEGGPEEFVFAKLYTKGHVRADRWYKSWRAESSTARWRTSTPKTVRRMAEYEDYALRVLPDVGVAVARPYGIVEITESGSTCLLRVLRWRRGNRGRRCRRPADQPGPPADPYAMGRRDRTPRPQAGQPDGPRRAAAIDRRGLRPGRPSPWRQAVDLGNMMLVLAVRADPAREYQQALNYFTEAELAEAFAATRGVASPTQLRAFMKRDPRDLLAEFRKLAPQRRPIVLQRWSVRRVSLAVAMLAVITAAVGETWNAFFPGAENLGAYAPSCGTGHSMILSAQAVPSAALLPCIAALPAGWSGGGTDIASGRAGFSLDSGRSAGAGTDPQPGSAGTGSRR